MLFHFVVPFCLLLSRTMKREAQLIVQVAALILLARLVDLFWLIAPEFHRDGISRELAGCRRAADARSLWLGCFVWQLRGRAILPVHDPQFDETLGRIIERADERPSTAH